MPAHDPGASPGEDRERGIAPYVRGRIIMRNTVRLATFSVGLVACTLLAAGCGRGRDEDSATQQAREALGIKEAGKERTVESKRDVIVEDTKKVIDAKTGEVLKTQETRTPVTVTEQKTIEHDVNVKPGETQKTVK